MPGHDFGDGAGWVGNWSGVGRVGFTPTTGMLFWEGLRTMAFESIDYFTEPSLVGDPYPYFDWLRRECPVKRAPERNVVAVTGYDEAVEVYRNSGSFSRCNGVGGPFPGLPVEPEGDDISDLIEKYRDVFPLNENFVTFDPPVHADHRHLLMRLITPKRLQQNEEFLWRLADRQIDTFHESGACEFVHGYAEPYATLTIADILGVPESDHDKFHGAFSNKVVGSIDGSTYQGGHVNNLDEWFIDYVEDRRRHPRDDALSKLANATFPDGSLPEVIETVRIATMLFAAGRGTTVHLLGAALQFLAEDPDLQDLLRQDRTKIPNFIEEVLRLESSLKANFRLVRTSTEIGGVPVKAGTTVMLLLGASNRDPGHFDNPNHLEVDRPNAREHLAFGRGTTSCPGGPLARAEARVTLERVLDRMVDIRLSDEHHGPADKWRFDYDPTFFLRRLTALHLEFTPVS
jgi:cytochrome P450